MANVELFMMCMVRDKVNHRVLVQDTAGYDGWEGVTMPGGHVENGESLTAATKRMMLSETGLAVEGLRLKGVVDWYNNSNHERWFMFLFETEQFSGELQSSEWEEGVRWIDEEELDTIRLAEGFADYLKIYQDENKSEGFGTWNDAELGVLELQ